MGAGNATKRIVVVLEEHALAPDALLGDVVGKARGNETSEAGHGMFRWADADALPCQEFRMASP
jgi:hypothetical protein